LLFGAVKQAGLLPAKARLEDFTPAVAMFYRQYAMGYRQAPPFGGLPLLVHAAPGDAGESGIDLAEWLRVEPQLRATAVAGSNHLSILKSPYVERLLEEINKYWYLV
jgi:thioesterase domain-containing protein